MEGIEGQGQRFRWPRAAWPGSAPDTSERAGALLHAHPAGLRRNLDLTPVYW